MKINYVYNDQGVAEYVVIPTKIWNELQKFLKKYKIQTSEDLNNNMSNQVFDPQEFYGVISHLNLNIEEEIKNIRNEWKRDF